jgi:hypothetical protein
MPTRQKLQLVAVLCLLGFGLCATLLDKLRLESYGSLAMLAVGISGTYFGLDTFIAPEKSLLFKFNEWLIGDNDNWLIRIAGPYHLQLRALQSVMVPCTDFWCRMDRTKKCLGAQ